MGETAEAGGFSCSRGGWCRRWRCHGRAHRPPLPYDRWDEVPLDRFRLGIVPQGTGRFGLGASVRF